MTTKAFRFAGYDARALRRCGDAFIAFVRSREEQHLKALDTTGWTELVLDWFCAAAAPGIAVDARRPRPKSVAVLRTVVGAAFIPRATQGEFLLDMVHSTYPALGAGNPDRYWERALARRKLRVTLALESEWGKHASPAANRRAILTDATKLACVTADTKVMVFATKKGRREAIVGDIRTLRRRHGDATPWLLVDLCWDDWSNHPPACEVLA